MHGTKVAEACLPALPPTAKLVADTRYDGEKLREWLEYRGTEQVIPPQSARKVQHVYDKTIYCQRNVIERMICRLKD